MKKLDNINELDALFKAKLGDAKVNPPADVWTSVSSSIGSGSGSVISQISSYFSSVTNIAKVALFVGGVSTVGALLYYENAGKDEQNTVDDQQTEQLDAQEAIVDAGETGDLTDTDPSSEDQGSMTSSERGSSQGQDVRENGSVHQGVNDHQEHNNGGDLQHSQSGETQESDQDNNLSDAAVEPNIERFEITLCLNEKKAFEADASSDWYVNGVRKAGGMASYGITFNEERTYEVKSVNKTESRVWKVRVQSLKAEIVFNNTSGQNYSFGTARYGNESYKWIIDNEVVSTEAQFDLKLNYGSHDVVLIVNNGACIARDAKRITVEPPKVELVYDVLSPNGDGYNDIYLAPVADYAVFKMTVTDAKGNIVFETTDPGKGWNGRNMYTGESYPSGSVFVVSIRYKLEGSSSIDGDAIEVTLR